MRVAFAGKGGSGKTTTVGVFARLLARTGDPTLVLDSDVMPGLTSALGMTPDDAAIPEEAVVAVAGEGRPGFQLRDGLDAQQAVEDYARRGSDGVALLQMGKLRSEGVWTLNASRSAYQQIIRELPVDGWHLVGDLPGGTRQPFFGWGGFADRILVIVEPTVKSFMTARRLRRLADQPDGPDLVAVANKVESSGDVEHIADETGLDVVAAIPYDPAVREADREGASLVDAAPDSPAVAAISSLMTSMREART